MTQRPLIRLVDPGVYFFRKPSHVSVRLNRDALVLFHHPRLEGCGLVLHDASHATKELESKLDVLLEKTRAHLAGTLHGTQAKIFGLSYYQEVFVLSIYQWLKRNKLEIVAQDIGRNVRRQLLIDCGTGNVGVRYSENYEAEDSILSETPGSDIGGIG